MTLSEKIARAEAAVAVENLQGRHVFCHASGHHREEYETLWSKKENIAWAHNYGTWFREKFYTNYVEGQESESRERYEQFIAKDPSLEGKNDYRAYPSYPIHFIVTPLIEVAEDGQSAKGLWYTPGLGFNNIPGRKEGGWMWERYGADFIMEDGEWRYKYLRIGMDIGGPVDTIDIFNPQPMGPPPKDENENGEMEEFTEENSDADQPGIHQMYTVTQVPQNDPRVPEPYKTLNEAFTYVVP